MSDESNEPDQPDNPVAGAQGLAGPPERDISPDPFAQPKPDLNAFTSSSSSSSEYDDGKNRKPGSSDCSSQNSTDLPDPGRKIRKALRKDRKRQKRSASKEAMGSVEAKKPRRSSPGDDQPEDDSQPGTSAH